MANVQEQKQNKAKDARKDYLANPTAAAKKSDILLLSEAVIELQDRLDKLEGSK